ncbi:MAG: hypothetical protein ACE367_22165 [Acidimicrobiales bacterium]
MIIGSYRIALSVPVLDAAVSFSTARLGFTEAFIGGSNVDRPGSPT